MGFYVVKGTVQCLDTYTEPHCTATAEQCTALRPARHFHINSTISHMHLHWIFCKAIGKKQSGTKSCSVFCPRGHVVEALNMRGVDTDASQAACHIHLLYCQSMHDTRTKTYPRTHVLHVRVQARAQVYART